MTNLAKELKLNPQLIEKIVSFSEKEMKRVLSCSDKCEKGNFSCLKKENDLIRLAVILKLALKAKERYLTAGISDEIYYATMSDIRIWCENNGNKGLRNFGWLKNHFLPFSLCQSFQVLIFLKENGLDNCPFSSGGWGINFSSGRSRC